MTAQQIRLVRQSLEAAAPQRNRLAAIFFARLFAREPQLRFLFRGDLRAQGQALWSGLAAIVDSLDRLHAIEPTLEWLALRAAARGAGERTYAVIGEELVATVEAGLGERFTEAHRAAWDAACRRVIGVLARTVEAEPLAA